MAQIGQSPPGQAGEWLGANFAKYYGRSVPFRLGQGAVSGAAGAVAQDNFTFDNYPNTLLRVSVDFSYQLSDTVLATNPLAYQGVDQVVDQCTIELLLAQQAITAEPIHVRGLQGQPLSVRLPIVVPVYYRGANQLRVRLVRLVSMPTFNEEETLPTAHITVATCVTMSDLMPGSSPGSSGYP